MTLSSRCMLMSWRNSYPVEFLWLLILTSFKSLPRGWSEYPDQQSLLFCTPLKVTILNVSLNMQSNYQRFMTFVILQALGHPCCCRPNLRLHNIIYIFWSFWLMSMSRLLDAFTNTGFQKFLKIFFFWMNNGKFSISKFILPGKWLNAFLSTQEFKN